MQDAQWGGAWQNPIEGATQNDGCKWGNCVMVGRKNLLTLFAALATMVATLAYSGAVAAGSGDNAKPFKPSANVMADVDGVLARAKAEGKLALIVMGANWCHDSQGLLEHFTKPEMTTVLTDHYEELLVDVGLLDKGAEVNQRFGLPVIYGTPTVMIIDPSNEKVLNHRDLQQWYNAASISLEDTIDYFTSKALPTVRHAAASDMVASNELKALFAEIDAFEAKQAKRIYHGFSIVGPMVGMERSERPENFYRLWEQLRMLRYRIPDDLETLRAVARRRVALGETDIKLDYPDYPALEWEIN